MTNDTADRRFWSSAAGAALDPAAIATLPGAPIRPGESFASIGDGFAAQIVRGIVKAGFPYVRAEQRHPALADIPAEEGAPDTLSAGYGEVATARQLLQLLHRSQRSFAPAEDRWTDGETIVDPFRPYMRYPARSDQEFELLRDRHFNAVQSAFRRAATVIVSLGAIEACESTADGAVMPIALDDPRFDSARHIWRRYTLAETIADLEAIVGAFRQINPAIRIVLMVSPLPIAATATDTHVIAADAYAKAVLRVAIEQVATLPGVFDFPAREIALASAPGYHPDRRTLTGAAAGAVTSAFVAACTGKVAVIVAPPPPPPVSATPGAPPPPAEATASADPGETPRGKRQRERAEARAAKNGETGPAPEGGEQPRNRRRKQPAAEGEPVKRVGRKQRDAAADTTVSAPDAAAEPRKRGGRKAQRQAGDVEAGSGPDLSHLTKKDRRAFAKYERDSKA